MRAGPSHSAVVAGLVVPMAALAVAVLPSSPGGWDAPTIHRPPPPVVPLTRCEQGGGTAQSRGAKGVVCVGGRYDRSPVVGE